MAALNVNDTVDGSPDSDPTLTASGIAHSFGGLKVLTDVSLSASMRKIVGLIGPNGSGKTTLFNILSGFLRANRGNIALDGHNITGHTVQQRSRAGLLRTFQTPKVFDHMTVLENIMMGAYAQTQTGLFGAMLNLPSARRELGVVRESAIETCERFNILNLAHVKSGTLPAGQRRVVELARAYRARPRVLLLDEPSSGLSSGEVDELRGWIKMLADDGMAIMLVSHDMGLMDVCDTVNALYFGRIIARGSMEAIRANKDVQEAYLGG